MLEDIELISHKYYQPKLKLWIVQSMYFTYCRNTVYGVGDIGDLTKIMKLFKSTKTLLLEELNNMYELGTKYINVIKTINTIVLEFRVTINRGEVRPIELTLSLVDKIE